MMTLTEFLLARIAEDERVARAASLLPEDVQRIREKDGTVAPAESSETAAPLGDWGCNGGPWDQDIPEAERLAMIFDDEPNLDASPEPFRVMECGGWDDQAPDTCYYIAEVPPRCVGVAEHIARHDPRRVLAECDGKRRIVGWAATERDGPDPEVADVLSTVLGFLALPYVDHPDYRDEWRP